MNSDGKRRFSIHSIILPSPAEELALPLNGRKNRLRRKDMVDYFAG